MIYMYFRIIESCLQRAEVYLLCDDPEACRLELAEVESILGTIVCARNKENMKRPGKRIANMQLQKTTKEVILRDDNNDCLLGSSPSLPRQLFDLPNWLSHSWNECSKSTCTACKFNPLELSVVVCKFFAYYGAALDMNKGIKIINYPS